MKVKTRKWIIFVYTEIKKDCLKNKKAALFPHEKAKTVSLFTTENDYACAVGKSSNVTVTFYIHSVCCNIPLSVGEHIGYLHIEYFMKTATSH